MVTIKKVLSRVSAPTHRQYNNALSVVVVALAIYIIAWPFLPSVSLWWHRHMGSNDGYVYHSKIVKTKVSKPIPKDNRLVVPGLRMNEAINEGQTIAALRKGTWRRPNTDTPDKGGNTVIIGHRFTYAGSAVFYNLDKINVGDPIIVYWQGKEYDYKVVTTEVVSPNAVQIEQHTTDPILTLYTCTPLWTAHDRLVVIARPI